HALVVSRAHAAVAALGSTDARRARLAQRTIGIHGAVTGAACALRGATNGPAVLRHLRRAGPCAIAKRAQRGDVALALVGATARSGAQIRAGRPELAVANTPAQRPVGHALRTAPD